MRYLTASLLFFTSLIAHADTMDHYMGISNQIPQMEMKADPQAQTWARSARNVLIITNESIAETLIQANELAKNQGQAFFCLPAGVTLNANTLNDVILKTYRELSSQQSDKDKMTVSQMAWLGVSKTWPCQAPAVNKAMAPLVQQIQHANAR
ncbi:phosphatase [Legionella sp. CNM-4043-24]|uniref:phosphatase n=1 Tax=Legionella sp. CNM-4043-24 TaxID=3421646 RepID=UPI00403B323A